MFVQSLFLQSLFENLQLYFGAVCAAELHIVKAEHHWPAETKWQFLFKERRIAPNWGWKQENAGTFLPEEKQKCKSLFCVVWSCSGTVARAMVDVWFRSTEVNVFYVKNHTLFNPCSQSAERSKGETFLGFDETCIPCAVEEACSGYEKPGSLCDQRGLNFKQASPLIKPTDVFCCNREALWWCACLKVCIKQSTLVIKVNTRSACVHPPSF